MIGSNTMALVNRIETGGGHYYADDNGERILGVTSVCSKMPKPQLDDWKVASAVRLALQTDKHPKRKPLEGEALVKWCSDAGSRVAQKAANLGNGAHDYAESFLLGRAPDYETISASVRPMVDCFLRYVADWQPKPLLVERVLVHLDPKTGRPLYAGTCDLIADLVDGSRQVVDWKGATKAPRTSHALQMAAYAHATHWLDETDGSLQPMPEGITAAQVVLLNGGEFCYRAYDLDISPVTFSVFKSLLRIAKFEKMQDLVILNGPLEPPK